MCGLYDQGLIAAPQVGFQGNAPQCEHQQRCRGPRWQGAATPSLDQALKMSAHQ